MRSPNSIYLANDAGTAWLAPAVLGTSATVQNSQCSIDAAASSAISTGNNLTVNLTVAFKAPYTGSMNIYQEVWNGSDSGWIQLGAWVVP